MDVEKSQMYKLLPKEKRNELEMRVKEFLSNGGIEHRKKIDITQVCYSLNLQVVSMDFPSEISDRYHGVILVSGSDRVIGVNKIVSPRSARFIVAHELAHYITEYKKQKSFAFADTTCDIGSDKSDYEREIDYMAASILVKKDDFLNDLKMLNISNNTITTIEDIDDENKINPRIIEMLAESYGVDETVIKRRILEVLL